MMRLRGVPALTVALLVAAVIFAAPTFADGPGQDPVPHGPAPIHSSGLGTFSTVLFQYVLTTLTLL